MRPRDFVKDKDNKTCNDILKLLDYLRKSQCTHSDSMSGRGTDAYNAGSCMMTLDEMDATTRQCLQNYKKNSR